MSDQEEQPKNEEAEEQENSQAVGEMFDRAERKALKEKKKKEEAEKAKARDEIADSLKTGARASASRKKAFKTYSRIGGVLIGGFVLYKLYMYLFNPFVAGPSYGICKVFLENHVRFPHALEYTEFQDAGDSVRVWFTRTDPFGYRRLEVIRCYYKFDEALGRTIVDRITIDRREVDPKKIENFNRVLSTVTQNLPDLTVPSPPSDKNLDDLQIDRTAGRKPIF